MAGPCQTPLISSWYAKTPSHKNPSPLSVHQTQALTYAAQPPLFRRLLQGDFVDRGHYSLETFTRLLTLKAKFVDGARCPPTTHSFTPLFQLLTLPPTSPCPKVPRPHGVAAWQP